MRQVVLFSCFFLCLNVPAIAALVEVTVDTDKTTYDLFETPTVNVRVYNPNNYEVVLSFGTSAQGYHVIDDLYNYHEGMGFTLVVTSISIAPLDSYTWAQSRYSASFLGVGTHYVTGHVSAYDETEQKKFVENTDPYYFEVVPEPATLLLLGFGGLVLRRRGA